MPDSLPRADASSPSPSLAVPVGPGLDGPRALLADAEVAHRVTTAAPTAPGQAFLDLLMLGALACQTPAAVLSVPQPDGTWSTLSYGLDSKDGLNDGQLFVMLSGRTEPFEIVDMVTSLPSSPLVHPPHSMRWAYGIALRTDSGALIGVVAVLDRWVRQLTKREHRAMTSMARQVAGHLASIRRPAPFARADLRAAAARITPAVPARNGSDKRGTDQHHLLRSHEVAVMFDVTERTVINWAAAGKLPSLRTMGGHLRFRREDVMRLLAGASDPGQPLEPPAV
jgi:excisionase family DNA binding protein